MSDAHAPAFLEPVPKTAIVVKLPSAGVPYKEGKPEAEGKLTLNAMTMIEEASILNPKSGVSFSQAVDRVLQKSIQESVDVNGLLSADKFYLFMMLRAVTYGQEYTFLWECSKEVDGSVCGFENTHTVQIPGDFEIKGLLPEDKEPFQVELPVSKKKIQFRLLRGFDEGAVEKYEADIEAKQKAGIQAHDTTALYRLARLITHVDDNPITKDISTRHMINFINSLPAQDISVLRKQMSHFTPGMDTTIKVVCKQCSNMAEMDLPITSSFFRPNYDNGREPVEDEIRYDVLYGDESQGDNEDGPEGTSVVPLPVEGSEGRGDGAGTS